MALKDPTRTIFCCSHSLKENTSVWAGQLLTPWPLTCQLNPIVSWCQLILHITLSFSALFIAFLPSLFFRSALIHVLSFAVHRYCFISSLFVFQAQPFLPLHQCLFDFCTRLPSVGPSRVFERVDVSADLERWSQFDVHAGHQMVFGEEQKRLAVDLLHPESFGHVPAACNEKKKKKTVTKVTTTRTGRVTRERFYCSSVWLNIVWLGLLLSWLELCEERLEERFWNVSTVVQWLLYF